MNRNRIGVALAVLVLLAGLAAAAATDQPRSDVSASGGDVERTSSTSSRPPTSTTAAPSAPVVPTTVGAPAVAPDAASDAAVAVPRPPTDVPPSPPPPPSPSATGTVDGAGIYALDPRTGDVRLVLAGTWVLGDVAPDGRRFFVSSWQNDAHSIVGIDGSVVVLPDGLRAGRWAPDGRHVVQEAYVEHDVIVGHTRRIDVWDSADLRAPARPVVHDNVMGAEWAGSSIVFTGEEPGRTPQVVRTDIVGADGTGRRTIVDMPYAAPSPDGRRLVVLEDFRVPVVYDVSGRRLAELVPGMRDDQSAGSLAWSPDGRTVVLHLLAPDVYDELCVAAADGSATRCGLRTPGHLLGFMFSADERELIVSDDPRSDAGNAVHAVDLTDGTSRLLLPPVACLPQLVSSRPLATGEVLIVVIPYGGPPVPACG